MRVLCLSISVLFLFCTSASAEIATITFDNLNGYSNSGTTGSYFDGYGAGASAGTWETNGVTFNTGQFGPGWSYSNVNDTTTAGFTNQWAAFPGTGVGGSGNYVIGSSFSANGAFFNLSANQTVESVQITNATYPGLSMTNGDAFAKKFGGVSGNDPDFFRVTFTGFSDLGATGTQTGSTTFSLADFSFADNSNDFIVDTWQTLNLTPLGDARSIGIAFETSDVGAFGPNTPLYVAIDNLTVTAVPEPSSFALLGGLVLAAGWVTRRYRKRRRA